MLLGTAQRHDRSPPKRPFLLTDVDQSFNMRLPGLLSAKNYRHQIGIGYFLRRNAQIRKERP